MDFNSYLQSAWNEHASDANSVSNGFANAITMIAEPGEISRLAQLIVHVQGEHLGATEVGRKLLEKLKQHAKASSDDLLAIKRSEAVLGLIDGSNLKIEDFSGSDQIKVLCTAASAQAGLGKISAAVVLFESAIVNADNLEKGDSANRAMAIAANNLACSLEEKTSLDKNETDLMLKAAQAGRKFWEIAGTWLETERAEYRLAKCYLRAGDIINSIKHANLCLTICESNGAEPLELFFAYEAIASVEKQMKQNLRSVPKMEKYFELLSPDDKSWCEKSLLNLKS